MTLHRTSLASPDAARLLISLLAGDRAAQENFFKIHYEELIRMARQVALDLAKSSHTEDVFCEFRLLLLCKKPNYFTADPDIAGMHVSYLRRLMKTAASTVRSQNPQPFQPKNRNRTVSGRADNIARQAAATNAPTERPPANKLQQARIVVGDECFDETISATPFARGQYTDPDFHSSEMRMDAHHLLEQAATTAKTYVHQGILLMYRDHLSITEAAKEVDVPHWQLRRDIDRWINRQNLTLHEFIMR